MENRREFLKYLAGLSAGIILPGQMVSGKTIAESDRLGELLPKRKLGMTGAEVTMLGVGGYHIGWTSEKDAQAVIETALEGGVRFFDSAESYGPHTSEIRYGKYLTPKYRDLVFLMTKTTAKDGKTAREHLEASLKRLNTDYLDLWQVHSVSDPEDVDGRIEHQVFEEFVKAKKEGKVRHIGFTGHRNPEAHLRVLERTAPNPVFETVQMPVNIVDASLDHFIGRVLPVALDRNMGVLAMKTMADGRFFSKKNTDKGQVWSSDDPIIPNRLSIQEVLHFVWSLPISVLITGAENAEFMKEKIELARSFKKIKQGQRESLIAKVLDLAEKGKVEYYKNV